MLTGRNGRALATAQVNLLRRTGSDTGRARQYQMRLLEKQKLRAIYGVGEKQFRRFRFDQR